MMKENLDRWLRCRSVSRARYGMNTVKVIRLNETTAGFGRRSALAPGNLLSTKAEPEGHPAKDAYCA